MVLEGGVDGPPEAACTTQQATNDKDADTHGEALAEDNECSIQDDTNADQAYSDPSGVCRLVSAPPVGTISVGTEEVDQMTLKLMPSTSHSQVEVDNAEQPDVLPVSLFVPEEADTSVSSIGRELHKVQQLMPTPSRPAHGVGKCNTDELKGWVVKSNNLFLVTACLASSLAVGNVTESTLCL